MQDFRDLKMFKRDGRDHVQEALGFLAGHWPLIAIVPVFQSGLTLEENVHNLREAGKADLKRHQKVYVYSGDIGLVVLFGLEKDRKAFITYIESVLTKYNQSAYVLCDTAKNEAALIKTDGQKALDPFNGTLDRLDELATELVPGFKTEGEFDRSISFVQMRDHQTRPKAE